MFKQIGGEIISDRGFRIRLTKNRISYIEDDFAYGIEIEDLLNPHRILLYTNSLRNRGKLDDSQNLSPKKRAEIISNTLEALDFLKIKYEISDK